MPVSGHASGWILGSGGLLEVDQHTVLPAIQALLDEAKAFTGHAVRYIPALQVGRPVGDPVSRTVAGGLNTVLWDGAESFAARCLDYATELVELAETCAEAARTYGFAESEIAAMFAGARSPEIDEVLARMRHRPGDRADGEHYVV